jgi:hypothetical protein
MKILESVAAKAATGWQRAGSKFDFEVFALPGGSVLAPALWVYSVAVSALKSSRQHSIEQQPPTDASTEERAPVTRAAASAENGLSCAWPRCHCT